MKQYLKNLLLLLIILITTNVVAYQATTEAGQKVQEFAENYKKFISYYHGPFTYVKFKPSLPFLPEKNFNNNGLPIRGKGSYAAKGGALYKKNEYSSTATIPAEGIDGSPLYGHILSELFDLATLLDSSIKPSRKSIANTFVYTGNFYAPRPNRYALYPKTNIVTEFKYSIAKWIFSIGGFYDASINYPSIASILKKIEPKGKNAIDPNKNYSEAAVTKAQVMAINNLNNFLFRFYRFLRTPEQVDNFFNYIAAFTDNKKSILEITLPEEERIYAFPTVEEAHHHLIRDIPVIRKSVFNKILTDKQFTEISQNKGVLYEYYFAEIANNNGDNVQKYANNLTRFLADYTAGYKKVLQPRNSNTIEFNGRYGSNSDRVLPGVQGIGTYAAIGGDELVVHYTIAYSPKPGIDLRTRPVAKTKKTTTTGITGQPLYGSKLYDLFEAAINLELYSSVIGKVFNTSFTDPKIAKSKTITQLKKSLVDFNYSKGKGILAPSKGLLKILYAIEPNGITGVDHTKNYSDAATDSKAVQAINDLNAVLEDMSKVLKTPEDRELFFNYIATFIDNGGNNDANVIIDRSKNLQIPEFQKYIPLPTNIEVMESLALKNNDYIKPMELTRISNDEDLNRILGRDYDDLDSREEEFKQWYKEARKKADNQELEKYDLAI